MNCKTFRVDWYPHQAFVDFSELTAEEIGVLIQIINLIYIHNRPIENDPKFIGKSCDMRRHRCGTIINSLIQKGAIYLTKEGKISKHRCELELETVGKRRRKYAENGKKGADSRWGNEEKQALSDGKAISNNDASTSTDTSHKKPKTSTSSIAQQEYGGLERFGSNSKPPACGSTLFDIDKLLSDKAREQARQAAPGLGQQELMRSYNDWIRSGKVDPPKYPDKAYPEWCRTIFKKRGGYL